MTVPLTLLGLLEREPSHGYDLKRDYDAYFGRDKPLPYGQVYATLSRLARDGMAIAGAPEPGRSPRNAWLAASQPTCAPVSFANDVSAPQGSPWSNSHAAL